MDYGKFTFAFAEPPVIASIARVASTIGTGGTAAARIRQGRGRRGGISIGTVAV